MVHVPLKPGMENFEHYFTSVSDEWNCVKVWAFFGIAFLWDWNETWTFPVLWPLLSFPRLLASWVHINMNIYNRKEKRKLTYVTKVAVSSEVHANWLHPASWVCTSLSIFQCPLQVWVHSSPLDSTPSLATTLTLALFLSHLTFSTWWFTLTTRLSVCICPNSYFET